jgi:hypothetical protein
MRDYIGEPVSGTWRLVITNYDTVNAGTLNGWDLLVQRNDGRACVVYPSQAPASIVVQDGTPQTGAIGSQFNPLVARVADSRANPLPGVPVIFQAPQSGASGNFPGNAKSVTVNTNEEGLATTPIFTANSTPGRYNVTAKVSNVMTITAATFDLTNVAGDANALTIVNGSRQGTSLNTAFPAQLQVSVRDSAGNPVPNTGVTFIPPDARAAGVPGGSFGVTDPDPESNAITVQTNALGIATAPEFTANGVPGTYNLIATTGLRSVSFSLTNLNACGGSVNPYVVTSGVDDGSGITCGTLSRALLQASPGTTVTFASGVVSLTVSGSLPPIRGGVVLRGESCASPVTLNGSGTNAQTDGLRVEGGGVARFLIIRNFGGRQIAAGDGGNTLDCVRAFK